MEFCKLLLFGPEITAVWFMGQTACLKVLTLAGSRDLRPWKIEDVASKLEMLFFFVSWFQDGDCVGQMGARDESPRLFLPSGPFLPGAIWSQEE